MAMYKNNYFAILIAFQRKYFLSPSQLKHNQQLY